MGSYNGVLTERLESFFDELSKTGLLESMVDNALLSRTSSDLRITFMNLHALFFDESSAAPDLYEKMSKSFIVTLKEITKDPVISAMIAVSHREIGHRLDKIDEAIRAFAPNGDLEQVNTFNQLNSTMIKMARGLQLSYRNIRVETNRGPKEVEINRIYIAPKLMVRSGGHNELNPAIIRSTFGNSSRGNRPRQSGRRYQLKVVDYPELITSFKRIVVLGDPGGGKSTLCQKFCYDMAKDSALAYQFKGGPPIANDKQRFPIRVVLRKFEQARTVDPQLDLLTYISRDIVHYAGAEPDEIRKALAYILSVGRVVLAFDGLDEILATSNRQDVIDLVAAFGDKFPLCPMLVTSRLVGYDDARLPNDFEEFIIRPFDDAEVKEYVTKFMAVVGRQGRKESQDLAQRFMRQTQNTAQDLRSNPLLLGLMSWLFYSSGDVPSNRPEIYKECSILMFEKWDQRRGIIADNLSEFDRGQMFISVASKIYGNATLSGGVTRAWLESTLKEKFVELYDDKASAFKSAKSFCEFITGRAWVMSEMGNDTYAFTHQTFLEYFFSRHLNDSFDSVPSILRHLKPRISRFEWNEVSHLTLQLKTEKSPRKQGEALDIISQFVQQAKAPKTQEAWIAFAGRALEYLSPSEPKVKQFVTEIIEMAFRIAEADRQFGLIFVGLASNSIRERGAFLNRHIADIIEQKVFSKNPKTAFLAAMVLGGNVSSTSNRSYSYNRINLNHQMRWSSIAKLKNPIIEGISKSRWMAGLSWSWYGQISKPTLLQYGFSILYDFPYLDSFENTNGLCAIAFGATDEFGDDERPEFSPRAMKNTLAMVGESIADGSMPLTSPVTRKNGFAYVSGMAWESVYRAVGNDPYALLGAIFARRVTMPPTAPRLDGGRPRRHDVASLLNAREAELLSQKGVPSDVMDAARKIEMFRPSFVSSPI